MRIIGLLLLMLLVSGCSPKLDDLHGYTENVKNTAVVRIEPYPEFESHPPFTYSAQDLRSPFIKPKDKTAPVTQARQANCMQPDFQRAKQKLESYGLDALALTGNYKSNGVQWALIRSNDGKLHKIKRGSRVGLFYGKVTSITKNSITIEQLIPDGAGCWQQKDTTLVTASTSGE